MLFKNILGHDETKRALVRSVQNNHVAHAQLFDGPVGGAGIALAWAFATFVNCEDRQPDDACGRCASCSKMRKLVFPDVYHIVPLPRTPKKALPEWLVYINATGNQ